MMEIIVLGSPCTRSTYYKETVQKIASQLGIDSVVEKIIDPDEIKRYGVSVGCSNSYCPGCNYVNKYAKGVQYTPALVIEGQVIFHSSFPTEVQFREAIEKII